MPDAQLARRFIVTAFTLEIRIAIYPIILFGDLRLMDLSWHGSHTKTVISSRNARMAGSSIKFPATWRPIASSGGLGAVFGSGHLRLAIAASSPPPTRRRRAVG